LSPQAYATVADINNVAVADPSTRKSLRITTSPSDPKQIFDACCRKPHPATAKYANVTAKSGKRQQSNF
jgi:hypothetical protein